MFQYGTNDRNKTETHGEAKTARLNFLSSDKKICTIFETNGTNAKQS